VHGHPLRDAVLALIDRDGTTTSTIAARELGESTGACSFHLRRLEAFGVLEPAPGAGPRNKPWRRVPATQATLNRELEDATYATWLATKASEGEDFAFSEVVSLTEGDLAELRARLHRVLHDYLGTRPTPTTVLVRAFPLHE
jgi:predicted ArsR family transcriptional regulator